jgi:hypothetical protein
MNPEATTPARTERTGDDFGQHQLPRHRR